MSHIMIPAKNVADAIRDRRAAAVRIAYDGETIVLWEVSSSITRIGQGIVFYTHDGRTFEESHAAELAVTGWV